MKIGIVCPYDVNKGGGVQSCVKALQSGLKNMGHSAKIITPRIKGAPQAGEDVIYLGSATDFKSPTHTTSQIGASITASEIDSMLEVEKFDVIHYHEPWIPILSKQILARSNCANVATFHAKLPETMMSKTFSKMVTPYTKSVLKYLDGFTAVSDAATEYLRTMTDVEVDIIPNGIDLTQFKSPKTHKEKVNKRIFYVGRLEKRKGLAYLLRAFAIVLEKSPKVTLTIAGDGVDKAKLEALAIELGIAQNVEFLGYTSETKKKQLLRSSDLFCSPAVYGESFGIVLLEAMASGLVTVAGNNPGYSAVMKDLGAISLVNPKRVDDMAHRINLLLNERDLRDLWRTWAKNSIEQYDYPNVVKMYETAYKKAIKARKQR